MPTVTINKKVCLLGDFAVGKTSLVRRFVYDRFEDKYLSTIGVKVSRKILVLPFENTLVDLAIILWDLAGSDEFDRLRLSYQRGAAGAVLVCDLTRPDTFQHIPTYVEDLRQVSPEARIILAANKADLVTYGTDHRLGKDHRLGTEDRSDEEHREPNLACPELEALAASLNLPYLFTSAKTGSQVEELFRHLGSAMLPPSMPTRPEST